jgi:hypothetical protein
MKTSKLKRMSSGSCLTKLYDKIIKMLSKSNEIIPLMCGNKKTKTK